MSLFPPFNLREFLTLPWTDPFIEGTVWIVILGALVTIACGLVGNYLILRRLALVGDAISHSVLPGIAIAFLLSRSTNSTFMFLGALAAGVVTTLLIEWIHKNSRIKQDAAIGITFSTLFAIGVILISLVAGKVDLDADCVLYGEMDQAAVVPGDALAPPAVVRMATISLVVGALITLLYKELLVSSFDPVLATSMGIRSQAMHYGLMVVLSLVVVSAFEMVGSIMVIAMLIMPGATAFLLTQRLPVIFALTILHAFLSSLLGYHLAIWADCKTAGAMVVVAFFLFCLAWFFSPYQGILTRLLHRRRTRALMELEAEAS